MLKVTTLLGYAAYRYLKEAFHVADELQEVRSCLQALRYTLKGTEVGEMGIQPQVESTRAAAQVNTNLQGSPQAQGTPSRFSVELAQNKSVTQNYSPSIDRQQHKGFRYLYADHKPRAYYHKIQALWKSCHSKYHTDYIRHIKWSLVPCKEECQKILQH